MDLKNVNISIMRHAITHWSNFFTQFLLSVTNTFFASKDTECGESFNKGPRETLYKIPRLGR